MRYGFPPDSGIVGYFWAKGHDKPYPTGFSVPAHTTYTWQVSVGAGKTWPANDDAAKSMLDRPVGHGVGYKQFTLDVGNRHAGGPLKVSFTAPTTLTVGRTENIDVTLTNRTGARIGASMHDEFFLWAYAGSPYGGGLQPRADLQVLENGRRVTLAENSDVVTEALPALAGLANGASHTYHLRIRLDSYASIKGSTTKVLLRDAVPANDLSAIHGPGNESLKTAHARPVPRPRRSRSAARCPRPCRRRARAGRSGS